MVSNMEYNKALRNGKLSNGFLNNYTFCYQNVNKIHLFSIIFYIVLKFNLYFCFYCSEHCYS